jgi:3-isopropylmalate/(R)-2-methylmalate dehydratase large subunit
MGQTITEKILSRVVGHPVRPGDIIYPEPEIITCHDWYVVNFHRALERLGVEKLYAPEKMLISTDHEPVALSLAAVERQKLVRDIVKRYGITRFFDAGRGGLGHIFPVEMGYIKPGQFVLAYDTHVTNFGAVGALGIALVIEISEVLACGSVWLRTPETVRVNITGEFPPGIFIRDVAQKLICDLGDELVDYTVVEYGGPAMKDIPIGGRFTLCNTPLEIGAKSTIVEPDQYTYDYLRSRVQGDIDMIKSDADAVFKKVVEYDLGLMEPQIAVPPTPDCVVGISQVAGKRIDLAFIGSCASGTLDDLRDAAKILKNRRISEHVRLIVTPATQAVMAEAGAEGLLEIFTQAGAMFTAAGCGPCAGGRIGGLGEGEVSINTGTRNDFGRLGAKKSEIYLASPATVAASAVTGRVTDPREFLHSASGRT